MWKFTVKNKQIIGKKAFWENFKRYLSTMKDGEFLLEYPKENKTTRSSQQRKYQWGCVYKILERDSEVGYTKDEWHQLLQEMFLSYEKEGKRFVTSTTKLNTKEMEDYFEKVRRFASMEVRCYIPLPNEPNNFYYDF